MWRARPSHPFLPTAGVPCPPDPVLPPTSIVLTETRCPTYFLTRASQVPLDGLGSPTHCCSNSRTAGTQATSNRLRSRCQGHICFRDSPDPWAQLSHAGTLENLFNLPREFGRRWRRAHLDSAIGEQVGMDAI